MSALVVIGVALAAFGSLVLLKFPDRPGGRIAWRGAEVSSAGAGLPLIVLGVATVVLAVAFVGDEDDGASPLSTQSTTSSPPSGGGDPASTSRTSPTLSGCFGDYFASVPADRIAHLEDGAQDVDVVTGTQPKEQPVGLLLTVLDQPVAATTVRFFAASGIFRVLSVVDASCRPIEDFSTSDSTDKRVVRNYGSLRIDVSGRSYLVSLGGDDEAIEVDFYEVAKN